MQQHFLFYSFYCDAIRASYHIDLIIESNLILFMLHIILLYCINHDESNCNLSFYTHKLINYICVYPEKYEVTI